MGCGSSTAGTEMRSQEKQQGWKANNAIGRINQAFTGFNPQFYGGVQRAYNNFALPQLYQQYQGNSNALKANLANRGLLNSGAAQQGQRQLGQAVNFGQDQIANQGVQEAYNMQRQVEQERSGLIRQAQAASNPSSVAQQAIAMAGQVQGPSTFAPIGNMFGQLGNLFLANQAANTYNPLTTYYNRLGIGSPMPSTANYIRS
jgi:hypothetical protein